MNILGEIWSRKHMHHDYQPQTGRGNGFVERNDRCMHIVVNNQAHVNVIPLMIID